MDYIRNERKSTKFILIIILGSRFGHSLSFLERLGILVVFGGRNQIEFLCILYINTLGDVNILRLDNFTW